MTQYPKTLNTILSNSPTPKSNKTLLGCIQYYYYGVGWDVFWGKQKTLKTKMGTAEQTLKHKTKTLNPTRNKQLLQP